MHARPLESAPFLCSNLRGRSPRPLRPGGSASSVQGDGYSATAMIQTDDQSECIVLERYRDSEALIEHAAHLGDLSEAILATGYVSGELLGEPSADLRAKMADTVVRLFTPYLSM